MSLFKIGAMFINKKNTSEILNNVPIAVFWVAVISYVSYQFAFDENYKYLYEPYGLSILTGLFFFMSIAFKNKIPTYLILSVITLIIPSMAYLMYVSNHIHDGSGSMVIFILGMTVIKAPKVMAGTLFFPMLFGYISARIVHFVLNLLIKNRLGYNLSIFLLFILFISASIYKILPIRPQYQIHNQTKQYQKSLSVEQLLAKYDFAKRVAYSIYLGKSDPMTNDFIISNGLYENIYKVENHEVIHGYNGKVTVDQNGNTIRLNYEDIPPNEICKDFFYANALDTYGFPDVYIDDTQVEVSMESKKHCYTGDKTHKISFVGSISKIKELSPYLFRGMIGNKDREKRVKFKPIVLSKKDAEKKYGHLLPAMPDYYKNNETLLGIDSNNNGVRDDVEWWIYTHYDTYISCVEDIGQEIVNGKIRNDFVKTTCEETPVEYHQIVREIAMQTARAAQNILKKPTPESMHYNDSAMGCNSYFEGRGETVLKDILIDHSIMVESDFKFVQYNTDLRKKTYKKYDRSLSGGVYSIPRSTRYECDFDIGLLEKNDDKHIDL